MCGDKECGRKFYVDKQVHVDSASLLCDKLGHFFAAEPVSVSRGGNSPAGSSLDKGTIGKGGSIGGGNSKCGVTSKDMKCG